MKTTTLLSGLLFLAAVFTSCTKENLHVSPSGNVTSTTMAVESFSQLEVSDAFEVYVTIADTEEVITIEASSNLHPYIQIENRNDLLRISFDDRVHIKTGNAVLRVYVSANHIDSFTAAGAVYMELLTPLQSDAIDLHLYGASIFHGSLYAGEIEAGLYGASVMKVFGTTDNFELDASGASYMEGFGFTTNYLDASLDGASNIELTVEEELKVSASGASHVQYKGNGSITSQDLSGASTVVWLN